ncbi:hypothetical protein EP073_10270 [Geovibrio thiophilus]|uniref:Cytochrome c domain-containing protein n=1 Tax=Geovibrio thiophilus TaxID=139438 RepID=A0A410K050_9BACT|nr:hypothetical protein [Geovibrio thiophilus]QAR33774.1 hypothetical protein EP073_10270 [Geovibrio thiophilus]
MKNAIIFLFAALAAVFTAFSPSPALAGILTESSGRSPACISCHSVSVMGLEGGYLASDISGFIDDFGAEGAADFLKNIPIEVMAAAYAADPLTDTDIEGLIDDFGSGKAFQINHIAAGAVLAVLLALLLRLVFRRRGGRE